VKITVLSTGKGFEGATALQVRPAALYWWDAKGQQQAARLDDVLVDPPQEGLPELQILPAP